MILTVRPATREEAVWLSSRLRPADRREVESGTGMSPEEVLPRSFDLADECYTIRLQTPEGQIDSEPCAIFGVTSDPHYADRGIVWFLATIDIVYGAKALLKDVAPYWLDHWVYKYQSGLFNFADMRNKLHLRWVARAGFTLGTETEIRGVPFVHFYRNF